MRGRILCIVAAGTLAAATIGCANRRVEDRVAEGSQGALSPVESGRVAENSDRAKADTEHQTAGLTGEMTNGKVDVTMEGSGNLAWQGSFEREKRAKGRP